MKTFLLVALFAALVTPLYAQTTDDGIMMPSRSLQVGDLYSQDRWNAYWEGGLKRTNGNIGTVTTQSNAWSATYGVTDRVTLVGSVPIVWTRPSAGVLQGQQGVQDATLGGKIRLLDRGSAVYGTLRAIVAVAGAFPLTDYTPDFAPLSIGSHSRRVAGRVTLNYQTNPGWYLNGSTAYWRRADVTLDRPYYYTDGQLHFSDRVPMPDVLDSAVTVGYLRHGSNLNVSFARQTTQGGGDIRRQDMPFVSNRMNFSRVGAMAMVRMPRLPAVAFQAGVGYTLSGRNVGQATSVTAGLLYTFRSGGRVMR